MNNILWFLVGLGIVGITYVASDFTERLSCEWSARRIAKKRRVEYQVKMDEIHRAFKAFGLSINEAARNIAEFQEAYLRAVEAERARYRAQQHQDRLGRESFNPTRGA